MVGQHTIAARHHIGCGSPGDSCTLPFLLAHEAAFIGQPDSLERGAVRRGYNPILETPILASMKALSQARTLIVSIACRPEQTECTTMLRS
jgi:hypothetical protein